MSDFLLDMEWFVCVDGYRIGPVPKGMLGSDDAGALVANSRYHRGYKPFQKYENLYTAFARLKSRDELLKFANCFGDPTWNSFTVDRCLRNAREFRELLVASQTGNKKVWATFKRQNNPSVPDPKSYSEKIVDIDSYIEENLEPAGLHIGFVELLPDPTHGVSLKIEPHSLLDGLWVQLARKLLQKTIVRTCRYCGSMFEAGAGSKKRADATFCCAEHSVRFHSLKRSKGA
jgi:hypothetical protein